MATATTNREQVEAEFRIPLPAPDGSQALEMAISRTEQLTTARMHETLRGEVGADRLVADYQFAAPDAMRWDVRDGGSILFHGANRYRKTETTAAWSDGSPLPERFSWPDGYYRAFWTPATAVRLVGGDVVHGTETDIVAFLRPDIAAWFQIWVGADDGIVRRMEMRAEGHLMDQTYSRFNQPLRIEPPQ